MARSATLPKVSITCLQDWHDWLAAHHESAPGAWLILNKKDRGLPYVPTPEVVEEALCWGWVDSLPNAVDEDRYKLRFSPRNPKSNWSRVNKENVARLLEAHRMQPAGLRMVELAKSTGTWTALDEVEQLIIPDDLAAALESYPRARAHFEAFPPSTRRGILEWILTAKQAATRTKRIEETARLAEENLRANQYRQPKPGQQ